MEQSYRFFCNTACQYFPCHDIGEGNEEDFNCLFCYCPLYLMGRDCGGNFRMVSGVKDCSNCLIPHRPKGYDVIVAKLSGKIAEDQIAYLENQKNEEENE